MFVILLPDMPPSVNSAFATIRGRRVLTKEQRNFRALVRKIVNGAKIPKSWKYVTVEIVLTPHRNMRFDVDNRIKPTLDALTECGFWPDDSIVGTVKVSCQVPDKDGCSVVVIKKSKSKYKNKLLTKKQSKNIILLK